jgi:hypothetical protein
MRTQGLGNSYEIDKYKELSSALDLFKEKRKQYLESFSIRPCMIIQIPFSDKGEKELEHLITLLNKKTSDGNYFYN